MQKPDISRVHQRFSRGLSTYQEAAVVQRRMAGILCELLKQTTGKRDFGTVLELGCGTGILTDAFASAFTWETLYLYDLIEGCGRYHAQRQKSWFQVADINVFEDYPQAELIISGATFQWIHDLEGLLVRLGRVLKPGGILAFTTFAPGNLREVSLITGTGLSYLNEATLCTKLSEAGFHIEHMFASTVTEHFPSPRAVLSHLKATGVTASTENRVWTKAALQEFEKRYSLFKTTAGDYPLTYTPLYCVASAVSYSK